MFACFATVTLCLFSTSRLSCLQESLLAPKAILFKTANHLSFSTCLSFSARLEELFSYQMRLMTRKGFGMIESSMLKK